MAHYANPTAEIAAAWPPRSPPPPSQPNPHPAPSAAPLNPELRAARRHRPSERSTPPATPHLPPGAPRRRAFGLRAQWYPADGIVYSDSGRHDRVWRLPERTRPRHSLTARRRSPTSPTGQLGSVAELARSVARAVHDGRTAPAVPPPGFPPYPLVG